MSIVDQLEKEHAVILSLLEEARQAGITTADGFGKLRKAKSVILNHLEKEEREIYPRLREEAHMASEFKDEMSTLSKTFLDFYARCESGAAPAELAAEAGRVVGALKMRIVREERVLYPSWKRATGEAA